MIRLMSGREVGWDETGGKKGCRTLVHVLLLYHYDLVFTDLEIFSQKNYKKKSENSKENLFERGLFFTVMRAQRD